MSKEKKTAGKTADATVRLDRRNRTVTLTIGGRFYDNLERAAKRMNTVEWCKGNTPLTVFRNFVWSCMGECIMPYSTLAGTITDFIDTHTQCDDSLEARLYRRMNPKDRERRDEMRSALLRD